MQRSYDHNTSLNHTVNRQNYQNPTITINREQTFLSPHERISNRHVTRSYSNNTSYVRSNGDESRIDKTAPFREYGDYNKSNITHTTSNNNTTIGATDKRRDRKLDYELKYRDDNIKRLENENKELQRELHRLRKIEAGWGIGGHKQNTEETRIHNTYIIEQNNNLKIELDEYKAKYLELEHIIENLEEEKRDIEKMFHEKRSDTSQEMVYKKEVERLKSAHTTEITKLTEERLKLDEDRKRFKEEKDKYSHERERYRSERDRYRSERDNLRQKLRSLESLLEEQKDKIREHQWENDREREREARIEDNPRFKDQEEDIKRKNDEIRKIQAEMDGLRRLKSEKAAVESQLSELSIQISQLTQENQFLHKKLSIFESTQKDKQKIEYTDSERVQELERLLEMYKTRITTRDDQINNMRKEVEMYKDEMQRYKLDREEIEIKSRLGTTIEHKKEMQKMKVIKIRTEELESRVKHLELENKRLRDVLQQSGIRVENNVYVERDVFKTGHFNNEIEDMGVKAVLKELEMERMKKHKKDAQSEIDRTLQESINDSWKAIH